MNTQKTARTNTRTTKLKLSAALLAAAALAPSLAHARVDDPGRPRLRPGVAMSPEQHRAWVEEIMHPGGMDVEASAQPPCVSPQAEANRLVDGAVAAAWNNLTGGPRQRVFPGPRGDAFAVARMRECSRQRSDDSRVLALRSPDPAEVPYMQGGLTYMARYSTVLGEGASGAPARGDGLGGEALGSVGGAAGGAAVAAAGGGFLIRGGSKQHRRARIDPTLGPIGIRFSVSF